MDGVCEMCYKVWQSKPIVVSLEIYNLNENSDVCKKFLMENSFYAIYQKSKLHSFWLLW